MGISDRITLTIPEFLKSSGVGRSKTYELIEAGETKSVLVGRRRLIVVQSYLDYLARQMQQQAAGSRYRTDRLAEPPKPPFDRLCSQRVLNLWPGENRRRC